MECKEAERLVMPYIQDELPTSVLEEFLEHVEACPDCQEELEIYFTVAEGLRHLEEETGNYNIKGEMERVLEASHQRVSITRMVKIICYGVNTLAGLGLLITFLLQLRIWLL
ncbi:MAG: zf-HC2 domain-containing protein [Lachnospiraceae bacterium]|jgi:hypothetical protein|nr:zf-HC2 domain-containing protein [Lachnospiraceae bacterium]